MQPEEQITIKDIILKVISIGKSILKNWKIVLLFALIGGGLGFYYDYSKQKDPTFKANNQFYLETSTPTNNYGGFANIFTGGDNGANGGLFSGENLLTLIKSADFLEKTFLREVTVNGKKHILANFFHDKNISPKEEKEKKEKKIKDQYVYLTHTNKEKFTLAEFNSLAVVQGPAVMATTLKPEEKTSFMNLEVITYDDTLSKVYSDAFLETLREYYLDSKTSKIKTTIQRQQRIVDSLRYVTQANESSLARIQDQNQETVFEQGKVQETRLNRKTTLLNQTWAEQERSLQQLKFQLYQDSPLFKITTPQRFPILPMEASLFKSYRNGILIGLFLSFIFIALADAVRSIMKEEKQ
jgi:hypothetical protein